MMSEYRDDIDGLRFLAVLFVILDHYSFGFSGGFIGVDVFFVISGYVISQQLYNSFFDNKFNFLSFYTRRIKRLFPVFQVVSLVSLFLFLFIYPPHELLLFLKNILYNNASLSNIYIWQEYGGYFTNNAKYAPLLHTWSLSVEEQFYLIFPFFLFLVLKYFYKFIFPISLACFFAFLYLSIYITNTTIAAGYYLLPSRLFELLFGFVVLLISHRVNFDKRLKDLASIVSLAILFLIGYIFDELTVFPGLNAFYPVLATGVIILSGGSILNNVLSQRVLSYPGKLSYSIYLWHWPIWVFISYLEVDTILVKILSLILVFLISYISYTYVENKFRRSDLTFSRSLAYFVVLPFVFFAAFYFLAVNTNGFDSRYTQTENHVLQGATIGTNLNNCLSTDRDFDKPLDSECIYGSGKDKVLLIGDSHANHLSPFLKKFVDDNPGYSLFEYTLNSCLPIFFSKISLGLTDERVSKCYERNKLVYGMVSSGEFSKVFVSASWPSELSQINLHDHGELDPVELTNLFSNYLYKSFDSILEVSDLTLFLDVPGTNGMDYYCTTKNVALGRSKSCTSSRFNNNFFDTIVYSYPGIEKVNVVNLYDILCLENVCDNEIDGYQLYRDRAHLTLTGSELLYKRAKEHSVIIVND